MCHINKLYSLSEEEEEEEEEEEDESTDTIHCGTRGIIPSLCLYAASIFSTCLQHFFQSSLVTAAIADLVSSKMALTVNVLFSLATLPLIWLQISSKGNVLFFINFPLAVTDLV